MSPQAIPSARPLSGELTTVADTGHAFGILRPDGVELLVHVGINTVALKGKGFQVLGKEGTTVRAGQPIIKVNPKALREQGYDPTVMLIVTDPNGKDITFKPFGSVHRGDRVNAADL